MEEKNNFSLNRLNQPFKLWNRTKNLGKNLMALLLVASHTAYSNMLPIHILRNLKFRYFTGNHGNTEHLEYLMVIKSSLVYLPPICLIFIESH